MLIQKFALAPTTASDVEVTEAIAAEPQNIGTGFDAQSFKEKRFGGLMDPLVMVDHFTMTEPTFGPHPHAGMSAVSVLFEDSEGQFNNRDSLGNDIDLLPGDLYWLKAGRGAVHDEEPRPGSRTHALQIFVNLPAHLKQGKPASLHVRAADMPVITGPGHHVRVVLGGSNGVQGAESPALPVTILDAKLMAGGEFTHQIPAGHSVWMHPVNGEPEALIAGRTIAVPKGHAVAIRNTDDDATDLMVQSATEGRFVLIQGIPIRESFVQEGPFVMSTPEDLDRVASDYEAGRLGSIT